MLNFKNIFLCVQSRLPAGNKPFYILLLVISLVFQSQSSFAQTNLIYNGDFELYDTCPVSVSTPSSYQLNTCLGWYCPTYATSDYFNTCAFGTTVAIPNGTIGYQWPYSGNAYCGVLIQYYAQSPLPVDNGWWVEYIQSRLISPLKVGYEYEFSCRIVLSDLLHDYAFWKFGASFSQYSISKSDAKPFMNIVPQVMNTANNFITDTLNWVEIKGKFIAQGLEEYITLGFYTDTLYPDTLRQITGLPIDPTNTGGYYFIDATSLIETGNIYEYPNVFSPNGDDINDEWNPSLQGGESVKIFNRWGIEVFEITGKNQKWDGRTTSGTECVDGIYFYVINNGSKETNTIKKGFIQLLR